MLPQEYAADPHFTSRDARDNMPDLHRVYTEYFRRCRTARAMDFDDLLLYTFLLFDKVEEVRKRYAQRFRYILVDEYQDTNYAQHAIVSLLTKDNHTSALLVMMHKASTLFVGQTSIISCNSTANTPKQ